MNLNSFSLTCAGPTYKFSLPRASGKPVDFIKILHSSVCSEESYNMTQTLHNTRLNMVTRLATKDKALMEIIDSVDKYLLVLHPFFNSLKNQTSVRLDAEMAFEWLGSFSNTKVAQRFPDVIFEVAMTLHTKSILHYNLAKQLLYLDPVGNLPVAGQHLHAAAGVMDYLGSVLLPQWINSAKRPPEVTVSVCKAMADLFTAETQHMVVAKKALDGGVVSMLTVKLCISALRVVDEGLDRFESISKEDLCFGLYNPIFNRTFYAALAYFYSGEVARLKDDVGIALGYYRESMVRVKDLSTGTKERVLRFDRLCTEYPFIRGGVRFLENAIETSNALAKRDNDMIFFQNVPVHRDLPALPEGILVMVRKMYSPPPVDGIVLFTFDATRASIPVGTRWVPPAIVTSSAPPASAMPSFVASSGSKTDGIDADHKYAMELQRKLDAGERI